ncbi:MAG: hypothetical protein WC444_05655 [Candidatus Paceibacterota bacterium]
MEFTLECGCVGARFSTSHEFVCSMCNSKSKGHIRQTICDECSMNEVVCNCCGKPIDRLDAVKQLRDNLEIFLEGKCFLDEEMFEQMYR